MKLVFSMFYFMALNRLVRMQLLPRSYYLLLYLFGVNNAPASNFFTSNTAKLTTQFNEV